MRPNASGSPRPSPTDGALKQTRLLAVHADQLAARLAERRQTLYARELFERSASVLNPLFWVEAAHALPEHLRNLGALLRWWARAVRDRGPLPILTAVLLLAAIGFAAVAITRWWLPRFDIRSPAETRLAKARTGIVVFLWLTLRTPLILIVGLFELQVLGLWPGRFEELGAGLVAATLAATLGRGVAHGLLAPGRPERRLIAIHDAAVPYFTSYLVWSTRALGAIILLQAIHKILLTPNAIIFATHALFALAVAGLLWRLVRGVLRAKEEAGGVLVAPAPWARLLVWLVIVIILGALVGGFVPFAAFIALRAVVAGAVIGVLWLFFPGIDALFTDALSEGTDRGRALAANLGIEPRNIGLINMLLSAMLRVLLLIAALLLIIGPREFSTVDLVDSFRRVPLAVRMGEITISLQALLGAVAVVIVVLLITRVVQRWLRSQLLPRTGIEQGLQHSIATIFGYVGIIAAISLALGSLGIDLQKIALIAGALSLGIGFGLQAVVSNFVSGLILLAERPIRVGELDRGEGRGRLGAAHPRARHRDRDLRPGERHHSQFRADHRGGQELDPRQHDGTHRGEGGRRLRLRSATGGRHPARLGERAPAGAQESAATGLFGGVRRQRARVRAALRGGRCRQWPGGKERSAPRDPQAVPRSRHRDSLPAA